MLGIESVGVFKAFRRATYYSGTILAVALLSTLLVIAFRELLAPLFVRVGILQSGERYALALLPGWIEVKLQHYIYLPAVVIASIYLVLRQITYGHDTGRRLVFQVLKDSLVLWAATFVGMPILYTRVFHPLLGDVFGNIFAGFPGTWESGPILEWYRAHYSRLILLSGLPTLSSAVASITWLLYRVRIETSYPDWIPGVDQRIRKDSLMLLLEGNYSDALVRAYKVLEDESRKTLHRFGLPDGHGLGQNWTLLFGQTNQKKEGPLIVRDGKWSMKGVRYFGLGAAQLFRNPAVHTQSSFTREEAIVGIYVADFLLRMLRNAVRAPSQQTTTSVEKHK